MDGNLKLEIPKTLGDVIVKIGKNAVGRRTLTVTVDGKELLTISSIKGVVEIQGPNIGAQL